MEEGLHLFLVVQQGGMLCCGTAVGRMATMVLVISLCEAPEANVHRCVHCRLLDLITLSTSRGSVEAFECSLQVSRPCFINEVLLLKNTCV